MDSIGFGCSRISAPGMGESSVELTARHSGVPGYEQAALEAARFILIGAGGLGGEIGEGLVRKGVKRLIIIDGDVVEPSNLSRQRFYSKDLWKNKAVCLAGNLALESINRAELTAVPMHFQVALSRRLVEKADMAVCGVDNNPARISVARHCFKGGIPAVFVAVSRDGDHGYVFVQEPGKTCFGCLFPDVIDDLTTPCPNTPAIKDIIKTVAGVVLYAVDTVRMTRKRDWNYKSVFLSSGADQAWQVPRRKDCCICGNDEGESGSVESRK